MSQSTIALQARWIPTKARPADRGGPARVPAGLSLDVFARLRLLRRSAAWLPADATNAITPAGGQHTLLECPCCALRAPIGEFDLVDVGDVQHHHCPGCDANLGSERRSLGYVA